MKFPAGAAAAALVFACLVGAARATCVISADGKSIDVVTDNGDTDEKNCAVKCRVDTKIGVAQVSCGGNAPPLAKAFSLCKFDKAEPYYRKVLSFEDSCKATPASATVPAAPAPLPKAASPDKPSFTCRVSADGLSVDAVVANPYPQETHCSVDCLLSATSRGATFSVSCAKTAAGGGVETVLCTQKYDKGRLVKMLQGKASCVKPLAANDDAKDKSSKDDDDDMPDQDEILKRMQRGEPMQNWLKKK